MFKRTLGVLLAALVMTVALGCESTQTVSDPMLDPQSVQPVEVFQQIHGESDALSLPVVKLVKSEEALAALGVEALAELNVDWQTQDVVIVALGEQPTAGYWVRIDAAQKVGDALFVQGVANAPGEDQAVTQQITYPFAAAAVAKTDAETALSDISSVTGQSME